jgi:hypothetical protein
MWRFISLTAATHTAPGNCFDVIAKGRVASMRQIALIGSFPFYFGGREKKQHVFLVMRGITKKSPTGSRAFARP